MSERVTIDVIDRPAGGLRRVVVGARAARAVRAPGMRALLALGSGNFVARMRPAPTPRRIALLSAWDEDGDAGVRWARTLGELCEGASIGTWTPR